MNLVGRDFLKLLDFTAEEITYMLDLAADLKEKKSLVPLNSFFTSYSSTANPFPVPFLSQSNFLPLCVSKFSGALSRDLLFSSSASALPVPI